MPITPINAPIKGRRSSKYNFTQEEVTEAIALLDQGENAGIGPYKGEDGIKHARGASQVLKRLVVELSENYEATNLATKAWEDDKGNGWALIRSRMR